MSPAPARFLDAPRHPHLQFLTEYWTASRGERALPSRADINPARIKSVLSDVMLWNVGRDGAAHTIRLVGENIVRFVGRNYTGAPATVDMTPDGAAAMTAILDEVAETRAPRFRAGRAFWHRDKSYRDFEACYLPLSPDGQVVDMILGGVVFEVGGGT